MKKGKLLHALYYLLPASTVGFGFYVANNIWIAMLSYHGLAIFVLFHERQGFQLKRLFSGGKFWETILWSIFAMISGVAIYGLGLYLNMSESLRVGLSAMGLSGNNWLLFILYYSIVNPVIEEIYWRGFLGSESRRLSWSDIGYGGYHPLVFLKFLAYPWAFLEFLLLAALGWFWRGMVKKEGGLLIPFAMHLCADFSIAVAICLLVRG